MSSEQLIQAWRARTEAALERALATANRPPRLLAAMRHAALGGGKRLRPLLVHAAGHAFGAEPAALDAPATAVELIHAFSLVHDDLPALDDDERRQRDDREHKGADDPRRSPAVRVRLDQAVRQGEEAERRRGEPRKIEARVRLVPRLVDEQQAGDDTGDSHWNVHEEDPVPAEMLGEQAAGERAYREGERGHTGPDADRGA